MEEIVEKTFSYDYMMYDDIIVKDVNELKEFADNHKDCQLIVGWTNGCFDILHKGHIDYLIEAKNHCDVLIVAMNSDKSVKQLKGENRPIQDEQTRAAILGSIIYVDRLYITDDTNMCSLLNIVQPSVFIKGGDYNIDNMCQQERAIIEGYGGTFKFLSFIPNSSTTDIIKKIREMED